MSLYGSGAKIKITGAGPTAKVEVDGQDISNTVTRAVLTLDARRGTELEVEYLVADSAIEVGGDVVYYAHAYGEAVTGSDPVTVLRSLADKVEKARQPKETVTT
jgi:hypothetical protein